MGCQHENVYYDVTERKSYRTRKHSDDTYEIDYAEGGEPLGDGNEGTLYCGKCGEELEGELI